MKTIIATIKPLHLGNIRRGEKKWEIRKTIPNCDVPFRVLCCESGSGGLIKAEFVVKDVKYVYPQFRPEIVEEANVSLQDAIDYAGSKKVWFWGISNMIDYCMTKGYKMRNISEFGLKRAPQSWQYIKYDE